MCSNIFYIGKLNLLFGHIVFSDQTCSWYIFVFKYKVLQIQPNAEIIVFY
jgi:hypothetical protein